MSRSKDLREVNLGSMGKRRLTSPTSNLKRKRIKYGQTPKHQKRIALELFEVSRRTGLHYMKCVHSLGVYASLMYPCRHCGSDCHVSASVPDMPVEDSLKVIDDITPHVASRTKLARHLYRRRGAGS